jgi:hypothetical protein
MKTIAALIAGLLLSVVTFLGGLMTGTVVVGSARHLEPQAIDTASLWTSKPMKVGREQRVLERLPARRQPETSGVPDKATKTRSGDADMDLVAADVRNAVDPMTTSATGTAGQKVDRQQEAHEEWCSRRYASYRAADNTYQPYSGARRTCVSPGSSMTTASVTARDVPTDQQPYEAEADDGRAEVQPIAYDETTGAPEGVGTSTHARSCAQRYRSYDAADNSYQPFDGGPRRQCE